MPRVTASSSVRERTRDWMPMSRNFFSKARAGTMMESMPLPVPMVQKEVPVMSEKNAQMSTVLTRNMEGERSFRPQ